MAKKKQEDKVDNLESIGSQMKAKGSAREANLARKAELIKEGKHPKNSPSLGLTQKERNLALKAKLNGK